jgi:uncharacterized OsmC-like protein
MRRSDLETAAFAACVLKNVERFGEIPSFHWRGARITVESERQDSPPKAVRVHYELTIETDEPEHRIELIHHNIRKYGKVYNTLAAVCEVTGELIAVR